MTVMGVVPTGFYGFTEETTAEEIITVTQLVYERAPAEAVEEILLTLGLCMRYVPSIVEPDLNRGGLLCKQGLHENTAANWVYPSNRTTPVCGPCKRVFDRQYKAQLRTRRAS